MTVKTLLSLTLAAMTLAPTMASAEPCNYGAHASELDKLTAGIAAADENLTQ